MTKPFLVVFLSTILAIVCFGWGSLAQAQGTREKSSPADEAKDQEARALFQAGQVAFEDGRFEDALQYFRRSYELSGRPALLYNIGLAADRLRRDEEALSAFERYLAEVPDARNRR
ncbi:MAG: tetratricopeptide repeat protein, partial [Deltaproteobacteria bacterium]|nr:tetratricopeptide repeat protein [Deltaproteobacteria bacterium]